MVCAFGAHGHLPTWGGPVYSNDDHGTVYTKAAIERVLVSDRKALADHVRLLGDRVYPSDVDLFGDLDGEVGLDADIANRALDLRMSYNRLGRWSKR